MEFFFALADRRGGGASENNDSEHNFLFRSEAPPNLSARAKKNSKGAPGFAERENPEERKPTPRDPGGRKRWLGSANLYTGFTGYTAIFRRKFAVFRQSFVIFVTISRFFMKIS